MSAQPSQQALLDAARWFVELNSGDAGEQDYQQWQAWLDASPQHRQAWERASALGERFVGLPRDLGLATLSAPKRLGRRQAIKHLALLLGIGVVGYGAVREQPWRAWSADLRTATGERREVTLADGTHLILNTASAVDVRMDNERRLLHLIEGEILVDSGKDARPLLVATAEGLVRPLGTRFLVRQQAGWTQVAVFSGRVALQPTEGSGAARILEAGQRSAFDRSASHSVATAGSELLAWTQGMLVADNMSLADFARELGRYRQGHLGCAAEVAELRISGAFPLNDTDRALAALEKNLPVRTRRFTHYWSRIEAR